MVKQIVLLTNVIAATNLVNNINVTNTVRSEYKYNHTYETYTDQKVTYDSEHLGIPIKSGTCKSEVFYTKYTSGWVWGSKTVNYDTLAYAIYNVGTANASYYSEAIGYIKSGSIEETYTKTISKTYEVSLSNELSTSVSQKATLGANYNALTANASVESEINNKVSSTIKVSNQNINTVSRKITFNIDEPGYYFYDLRATFNMYVVQVYKIKYDKIETDKRKSGLWTYDYFYEYKLAGYELIEDYITFSLVTNLGISITKYLLDDDGHKIYDGPKENLNHIYF